MPSQWAQPSASLLLAASCSLYKRIMKLGRRRRYECAAAARARVKPPASTFDILYSVTARRIVSRKNRKLFPQLRPLFSDNYMK